MEKFSKIVNEEKLKYNIVYTYINLKTTLQYFVFS